MSEPLSREEFLAHIDYVRHDIAEVKEHVTRLNGRTGDLELDIAVLKGRLGTGPAVVWGSGAAGAVVGFIETVKWWLGKP